MPILLKGWLSYLKSRIPGTEIEFNYVQRGIQQTQKQIDTDLFQWDTYKKIFFLNSTNRVAIRCGLRTVSQKNQKFCIPDTWYSTAQFYCNRDEKEKKKKLNHPNLSKSHHHDINTHNFCIWEVSRKFKYKIYLKYFHLWGFAWNQFFCNE